MSSFRGTIRLSIQDGLQPGLLCVAIDMQGFNPFENKKFSNLSSSLLGESRSILKSPEI